MAIVDASTPQLLLVGAADTLSLTAYGDGVVVDPGVTTVSAVDETGATVLASTTASGTGGAARTAAVTPAALGRWTVTWVTTSRGTLTTFAEVVGAHLFTIAEARAFDTNSPMAAASAADIGEVRARILSDFEAITGSAFVPRWNRVIVSGDGCNRLFLPVLRVRSIIAVEERTRGTQTWTALDTTNLNDVYLDEMGRIQRETLGYFSNGIRNYRVTYTYGFDYPPAPIRRAALMAAAYEMQGQTANQRAISVSTATGTTQYWTPGYSGRGSAIHQLPEVDRILRLPEYQDRLLVVA